MLELRQLSKIYLQGGQPFQAVQELSLTVQAGEIYGLLGANGAGKTTTLRMILGLTEPSAGDALVQGVSVLKDPEGVKARIGLVTSSGGLYPWLTVQELLEFFCDAYNVPTAEQQGRLRPLAEQFGLVPILSRRCGTLSTGQRQRVHLARAVVHDPPLVLLDEPTRGLDVVGSRALFDFVRMLRGAGKAVLVCTHRLEEAERLCDRFGLLHGGTLRKEGTLPELQSSSGEMSLVEIMHQLIAGEGKLFSPPALPQVNVV